MKVYDSSAVMALLNDEPGADAVASALLEGDAHMSAANYAEIMSKVYERGTSDADARALWTCLKITVQPLTEAQGDAAARLRPATRGLGLSLGDRCCLALASTLQDATVVTADRAWKAVKGFRFEFIR